MRVALFILSLVLMLEVLVIGNSQNVGKYSESPKTEIKQTTTDFGFCPGSGPERQNREIKRNKKNMLQTKRRNRKKDKGIRRFNDKRRENVDKNKKKSGKLRKKKEKGNKKFTIKNKLKSFMRKIKQKNRQVKRKNKNKLSSKKDYEVKHEFGRNMNDRRGKKMKGKKINKTTNAKKNKQKRRSCEPTNCTFDDLADIKKKQTKHLNTLAKLKRIVKWWNRINTKRDKVTGAGVAIPTFDIPFTFLSGATSGGTTCNCAPITDTNPDRGLLSTAYNSISGNATTDDMWNDHFPFMPLYTTLQTCTATATAACSTAGIVYDKLMSPPPCGGCTAHCCVNKTRSTGCPPGWKTFEGNCYHLIPKPIVTYNSAEKKCQEFGADLVSLETKEENDFIGNILNEAQDDGILSRTTDIWLSAKRPNTDTPFTWKNGDSLDYTNWRPGQPEPLYGHTVALCSQGTGNVAWTWAVTSCEGGDDEDVDNAVVCEKRKECDKPVCTTTCTEVRQNFTLTQAMIDHMDKTCIPQLFKWTSRYRACGACLTQNCRKSCQGKKEEYDCQARQCKWDNEDPHCPGSPSSTSDCQFEDCLRINTDNGFDLRQCVCDCYKDLDDTSLGSNFPIDTTTFPSGASDDLDCIKLSGFERLVKIRRDRCLLPGGITDAMNAVTRPEDIPYVPINGSIIEGNLVDCRIAARKAFAYIYVCKGPSACQMSTASPVSTARSQGDGGRKKFLMELKKNHIFGN